MAHGEAQFHGTQRFRIVSRISVGAAGELYKAMDESRGSFVALRTLRGFPTDAGEALRRDFRALKAVRHPSLVNLGDVDCADGLWFYTMEFVEGETLLDYVRPRGQAEGLGVSSVGELSEVRLRSSINQLVRAVAALHQAGRVHGNVEPEHMRVTPQGRVVLLESALGRATPGEDEWESDLVTTMAFVAPERLEGAAVSQASDWYSVGAVLFQALSGASPFPVSGSDLLDHKQQRLPQLPRIDATLRDLAALCMELLSIDPDARPLVGEICTRLGVQTETESRVSQSFSLLGETAPFVGRKRELALLAEAFERTRHGALSTLCLYGKAGIGKRTLTGQLVKRLRAEYPHLVYLSGRCDPDGPRAMRGVSGVVDTLSRYLASQDASSVATLLPNDAGLLPRLFPTMERIALPAQRRMPQEPPALRRLALRALRSLLRDLSKRHPVLIVIEDAQWIDGDALSAFDELLRAQSPPDMLLVLLIDGEVRGADAALRGWLTRNEEQITMMRLKDLGETASLELAERLLEAGGLTDRNLATAVAQAGGGHPLRIDALARHFLLTSTRAPAQLGLEELLWARVAQLPLDARQLLIALCYARVPLPPEVAAEAADLPLEQMSRHLAVLRVANLGRSLREDDSERLGPSHHAVGAAVLRFAQVDRARIHRRLALAMAAWPKAPDEVVASHFRDASMLDRAAISTAQAADRARDGLAFDAAVKLYQEALAYERCEQDEERRLRIELAHAYASAGQSERAAGAYIEAARYAAPAEALELERRAAQQLLRTGHIDDGLRAIHALLDRLHVRLPDSNPGALLSLLFRRTHVSLRGLTFERRDATQIAPNDLMRADVLGSLAAALSMVDSIRGADAQARFLLLTLRLGDPARIARALALEAGYLAATAGEGDKAWDTALTRAEALASDTRDAQAKGLALTVRSTATFLSGKWHDNIRAAEHAERVLSSECTDVDWEIGNARIFRSLSYWYLGDLRGNSDRVAELMREAHERGDHYTLTNLRLALGYVPLLMANEPTRARAMLDEAIESWNPTSFHMPHYFHALGATQVDLYERRGSPYDRVLLTWPQLSRSFLLRVGMVSHSMQHLRARAALSQASHHRDERELLLRDAASLGDKLTQARAPYAAGWGHTIRAAVFSMTGDRENALQRLEQAEAAFYEGDMTLYAAATRYQLGRLLGLRRGQELRGRAEDWFEAQGVRRPTQLIGMLLPGFDS